MPAPRLAALLLAAALAASLARAAAAAEKIFERTPEEWLAELEKPIDERNVTVQMEAVAALRLAGPAVYPAVKAALLKQLDAQPAQPQGLGGEALNILAGMNQQFMGRVLSDDGAYVADLLAERYAALAQLEPEQRAIRGASLGVPFVALFERPELFKPFYARAFQLLKHPDAGVREAFGAHIRLAILGSIDPQARERAPLASLVPVGVPELQALLAHTDKRVALTAALAWVAQDPQALQKPEVSALLLAGLGDPAFSERNAALGTFRLAGEHAAPFAEQLGRTLTVLPEPNPNRAAVALEEMLGGEGSGADVAAVLAALGAGGKPAVPALAAALKNALKRPEAALDSGALATYAAALACCGGDSPEAVKALEALGATPEPRAALLGKLCLAAVRNSPEFTALFAQHIRINQGVEEGLLPLIATRRFAVAASALGRLKLDNEEESQIALAQFNAAGQLPEEAVPQLVVLARPMNSPLANGACVVLAANPQHAGLLKPFVRELLEAKEPVRQQFGTSLLREWGPVGVKLAAELAAKAPPEVQSRIVSAVLPQGAAAVPVLQTVLSVPAITNEELTLALLLAGTEIGPPAADVLRPFVTGCAKHEKRLVRILAALAERKLSGK